MRAVLVGPALVAGLAVRVGPAVPVRQAARREQPGAQRELVSVRPQVPMSNASPVSTAPSCGRCKLTDSGV